MAKPNYDHWDLINEFSLDHAAALCCDIEPEPWEWRTNPAPAVVLAMRDALERKCPPKVSRERGESVTQRLDPFWLPGTERYSPPRERITKTWPRAQLRAWAEATGHLAAMPFLKTPEERAIPTLKPGPASVRRADAESNLYALVGLLSLALAERGGNNFWHTRNGRKTLNLATVQDKLAVVAKDQGIDTAGLGASSLASHLTRGQAEIEDRRPEVAKIPDPRP
ncbi:MAG: hypothetical protein KAX46_04550 [Chromatiaceae bacterium]|nr:hypothetical protein [Chromatiaceae bacterium]